MCYTYDSVGKVLSRTVKNLLDDTVISTETFTYDSAGNITDAPDLCFEYDTNNRLTKFCNNTVSYDLDGNMLSNGFLYCTYDSANRLVYASGQNYTYNAEDVRIRNLCIEEDTTYTYDTNTKLSRLLYKTTNGIPTKYVYGRGLIGEEINGTFKTYHFDCRGSTIAITDASGNITDTFAYDTYGKLISKTGTSKVIFGYNGRDGVVTDDNGLIYMRARYYSPEMKRFINADIVAGEISNAVTLNRFAYANGNPVSFVDPFGLSPERTLSSENSSLESYNTAILVIDYRYLEKVGHSTIYFQSNDGKWYKTEFNLNGNNQTWIESVKHKHESCVTFSEISNEEEYPTNYYSDSNYGCIKLTGNFNNSVKLAEQYAQEANNDFNGYNFLVNNCADYTDILLDEADVDGMFSQIMIGEDDFISIPTIRKAKLTLASQLDSKIQAFSDNIENIGKKIKDSSFIGNDIVGDTIINASDSIIKGSDSIGDTLGSVASTINSGLKPIKDTVAQGVKNFWDVINPF